MASEGNTSSSSAAKPLQGDSASGAKSPFTFGPGFSVPLRHPILPPPKLALPLKHASPAQPDLVPSRSPTPQANIPTSPQPQVQGGDTPMRVGRRNRLLEPYVVTLDNSVL